MSNREGCSRREQTSVVDFFRETITTSRRANSSVMIIIAIRVEWVRELVWAGRITDHIYCVEVVNVLMLLNDLTRISACLHLLE